jgi:protein ImuB
MSKRFLSIWFRHLKTDWMIIRNPELKMIPFVLALPDHGRMRITEVSAAACAKGIETGMVVADAKIILPGIKVMDDNPGLTFKLLTNIARWCIRYTPIAAIDTPDGIMLDISGCSHLWGGEQAYLKEIITRLRSFGYHVRAAIADTTGAAWAICHYGKTKAIIPTNEQMEAISNLPPAALRLEQTTVERLHKLGLHPIGRFSGMQRSVLRRRFGQQLLVRLDQALGTTEEIIEPVIPLSPYCERLHCLEPITTKEGIEIALEKLLQNTCSRLEREGKGLRNATFTALRLDNKTVQISISTSYPSNSVRHLFKLLSLKIAGMEPATGIELFLLEVVKVEKVTPVQETFWTHRSSLESKELTELFDSLQHKFGNDIVHRYLPDEHYLPERSVRPARSLSEKTETAWRTDKPRPILLLKVPQLVEVTAPIPDYPPMNFRYKGKLHTIKKADACERIEPEWWLDGGLHRDYYIVEDEEGKRYWLFRAGHYHAVQKPLWYLHGYFA